MSDTITISSTDNMITSSITAPTVLTGNMTYTGNGTYGSIAMGIITDEVLDRYSFNRLTIDHKVQEQELMKLKETVPTYADEIKENLAKNMVSHVRYV